MDFEQMNYQNAWHRTYRQLSKGILTVEDVEDMLYNDRYPPLEGYKRGMQAALDTYKQEQAGDGE